MSILLKGISSKTDGKVLMSESALLKKGGMIMAQREYKLLGCRDLGADCDFLVRAEKEDEVMTLVSEHVCRVHGRCKISPELKDKMQVAMKKCLLRRGML